MENKIKQSAILNGLAGTNKRSFNYLKCVEELSELSEVLMKKVLKSKEHQPSMEMIIDEIGDVELRLIILKNMLNCNEEVDQRKISKINKLESYLLQGLYNKGV